jgi:hypothetical protein
MSPHLHLLFLLAPQTFQLPLLGMAQQQAMML